MTITTLTDREHILKRPAMYIGSTGEAAKYDYVVEDGKVIYKELSFVAGLIKIINEIIDNSVDVAIKTKFKSSNNISITMTSEYVEVSDNGTGIPVSKSPGGEYIPKVCWGNARTGSNFEDDSNRTQIGYNGVGSFATNCFSKLFIGISDDGLNKYKVVFKDNALSFTETVEKSSKKTGVNVRFFPDLERFGLSEITKVHQDIIHQRLINLSMSFPEITFKFNKRKIKVNSFKKYVSMFSDVSEIYETENYSFAVLPNDSDDFRQFSYVNGLKIPDGGTHIDIIGGSIINKLRERLMKKYKTIKPGDIKNKLMIIAFLRNVKNTKFNSQSKEKITNSIAEMNNFFGEIDFTKFAYRVFKNPEIIDPITEVYRIKEEFKRRQELKGLKKSTKRIKSEKYYPSIGVKKYLMLVEGESAFGGLSPVFGRKECGYYVLRGKPLNAYSAPQTKMTANKELSELYKIIQNENYEYIVQATDQDLDGFHIRGLLIGFFAKYLTENLNNICMLQTPVISITKKDKITRWVYRLSDDLNLKNNESANYMKGLGGWDIEDLQHVVATDGINKMINKIEFDSADIIDEWLGSDSAPRKKYILANDFSIAKL